MGSASRSTLLAAAGLAGLALAVAGCGGSSSPGVAHLSSGKGASSGGSGGASSGPESTASTQQKMVAFAKCMRANGVPDFPEPVEGHFEALGRALGGRGAGGRLREAGPLRTAAKQCRKLLPNGGQPTPQQRKQIEERALKLSACMRSHGVPNFPTPSFEGGHIRLELRRSSGLNPNSPQFQAAIKVCRSSLGPGFRGGGG